MSESSKLLEILEELAAYFDGDWKSVVIWIRRPHPGLDGKAPIECGIDVIAGLVRAIGTGEPG